MNRNQRRMAAFNAKKAAEKRFENKIGEILLDCSPRVDRATSFCSLRDKPEQEVSTERRNSIYYKDNNPFGNKIHATQRMKLSSKPLI